VSSVNKEYFDVEAFRYLEHAETYRGRILDLIFANFVWRLDINSPLPVLEVGQGAGVLGEAILTSNLKYTAVDISAEMLSMAQMYLSVHAPDKLKNADFIHADVIEWASSTRRRFQSMMMQAVIHLFPKQTAQWLLCQLGDRLEVGSYLWLATTEVNDSTEGWFIDGNPKRPAGINLGVSSFRAFYTRSEFMSLAESAGFEIVRLVDNKDAERDFVRNWLILICRKGS
jgi:2-polyprenyl-3-methyl-5-hydroxy-6-metoxy-1,4-benzoquinol methylase